MAKVVRLPQQAGQAIIQSIDSAVSDLFRVPLKFLEYKKTVLAAKSIFSRKATAQPIPVFLSIQGYQHAPRSDREAQLLLLPCCRELLK